MSLQNLFELLTWHDLLNQPQVGVWLHSLQNLISLHGFTCSPETQIYKHNNVNRTTIETFYGVVTCCNGVVSERFHESQNENNKNSHRIKFLVTVQRQGLCWFSLKCQEVGLKYFKMNKLGNDPG